jgi:hypothetical protein
MKKKKPIDPEVKQTLAELEEVVEKLGYKVRYDKGNFVGGHCVVKELKLFVVNSRTEPEKRVSIIARNLKQFDLNDIYIKPQIRELIEKESKLKIKDEELETEDV